MTEDQIERSVEKQIDALDKEYLAGKLTNDEYDRKMANIDAWAKVELETSK